jgi:hypothetical protein
VHVAVHEHRAERGAALPGRAEPAEERPLDGEVEVGVRHHDERVLPAELEARRLEVAAAELADPPPDVGRPGEPDLVHHAFVERSLQPGESLGPIGQDELDRALGEPGVQEQLSEGLRGGRRVLRRLPHDRVPAQERRDEVPARHGDREVPRRHDRRDADRHAEREQLLVGHLARHGLAVEATTLTEEEVAGVHRLLDLAS